MQDNIYIQLVTQTQQTKYRYGINATNNKMEIPLKCEDLQSSDKKWKMTKAKGGKENFFVVHMNCNERMYAVFRQYISHFVFIDSLMFEF